MLAKARTVVPPWRWWLGFFMAASAAVVLTYAAYKELLPPSWNDYENLDKGLHFSIAGLLAFFLDGALRRRSAFTVAGFGVPLSSILILVPVAIEEFVQRYSIVRTSSLYDFSADVAGVVIFTFVSRRAAA